MQLAPAGALRQRTRSISLAVALWLFGLSTTVLLIGLWGRSVAVDEVTLETSTRAVLESELVNDRMTGWVGDAMAAAADTASDDVADAVAEVASSAEFGRVLDDLVDQSVAAALAPPGSRVAIDLSRSIDELLPVVVGALAAEGVVVDGGALRDVAQVQDVVLFTEAVPATTGAARSAAQVLTSVVVIGLGCMIAAGLAAVMLAHDRLRQLRSLALRLTVSALTFAIILRVGAWAVDPRGGRSPVRAGGSELLGSNGHVPLAVAVTAGIIVAGVTWALVRRRRATTALDGPGDNPVDAVPHGDRRVGRDARATVSV